MIAHPAARPLTRETFARQGTGCLTRDRRSMAVASIARAGSTQLAPAPDSTAVAEAKRRLLPRLWLAWQPHAARLRQQQVVYHLWQSVWLKG